MENATFDMERGIARCRVLLSLIAILALYVDPTEPTLTRWLPLTGGAFTVNRYWATVLVAHLAYSVALYAMQRKSIRGAAKLATIATVGDVLFAAAIALVTEGTTSPFYSFFAFAVLTVGLRSGLVATLVVTALSVSLYVVLVVVSAPHDQAYYIVMRAAYIAITGYLVGFLGQERLKQEARIRDLETNQQREHIARSLHDGYAQALAGVNLRLQTCRELLQRSSHDEVMQELTDLQAGVNREHDELRVYIRSLVDLDATQPLHGIGPNPCVTINADFRGSAQFVEHALLIMLEGVRNIRRHARARVGTIEARLVDEQISLTISDDGIGFPYKADAPWSMQSRVSECGGTLRLGPNDKPGAPGARLRIALPGGLT